MPKSREPLDWRASMKAQVNSLPTAQGLTVGDGIAVDVDILPGAYGAVLQAAAARRISIAAYVRRAALAMAAYDLNMPLRELVEVDPRMVRNTGIRIEDPQGVRFGSWEIESLFREFQ